MKILKRTMSAVEQIENLYPCCQASLNSDGYITIRTYDPSNKDSDKLIILSDTETNAILRLFSIIGEKHQNYHLPF